MIIVVKSSSSCVTSMDSLFSLPNSSYHQLLLAGPVAGIQCPHRVDEYQIFTGQPTLVSLCRDPLENFAYELVLFILLVRFMRWEASGSKSTVLLGTASSVCSKEYAAFFCSSHLAFSLNGVLKSRSNAFIHCPRGHMIVDKGVG